jgi:hypothetical protein
MTFNALEGLNCEPNTTCAIFSTLMLGRLRLGGESVQQTRLLGCITLMSIVRWFDPAVKFTQLVI